MRMKAIKITTLAMFLGAALLAQPALADKGGKGKEHKGRYLEKSHHDDGDEDEDSDHERKKEHKDEKGSLGFNDKEVDIITGILRGLGGGNDDNGHNRSEIVRPSQKFCPPGLAKKNNGCMPPGLAKKYAVGERLPKDSGYTELSDVLREALGLPPKGKKYVQVDNDVLLIEEGTRLVLDAIGLGSK